jgi:steroid 5-alpha reductase family enzyme
MTGSVAGILAINAVVLLTVIVALWAIATRIRDASFIDAFWSFGMVMLCWLSWVQLAGASHRANLLLGLVTLWGLRLAVHLFIRWRAQGEDPRYVRIIGNVMEKKGWSWNRTALIMVFLMQAPLLFLTCLPAQLGILTSHTTQALGPMVWIGAIIALTGIAFETIGDMQLKAFRRNPTNKGQVLDTGLWRYTRHPNYFGDFITWWGIWLVAAGIGWPIAAVSIIGPLFLSFTLLKWSGGPMLERGLKKSRPEYSDYIARTSGFFPLPPKKRI